MYTLMTTLCFLLMFANVNSFMHTPIVAVELTDAGFHRNLIYKVSFAHPLIEKECEYVLRQRLPASVYVSVDQLDDLQRLKKLDAFYPTFLDVEKPTEKSKDFVVLLKGVPKLTETIILPIHFRYHAPKEQSSFVAVDISDPTMYIKCPRHEQYLMESQLQIEPNTIYCLDERVPNMQQLTNWQDLEEWHEACNWKYVQLNIKLKSALTAEIPVGNQNAYPAVLYATIVISWIAALWTVFHTRNTPKAINEKLEEQRLLQRKHK